MNILITAPSLDVSKNVSGISTVVNTIIANNPKHNYHHYLLGRPDKQLNKVNLLIQQIKQITFFPFFIKKHSIELVHQNLPFNPKGLIREYIINTWCMLMNIPVLLHVHGGVFLMEETVNPFFRFLSKLLFKHSKLVIVLSDLERVALHKNYHYEGAKVLSNSVPSNSHKNLTREWPSTSLPVFLFLGRIHESKGILDILEALKILKKTSSFKFILCGTGPIKDQMIDSFKQILGDNFEYGGIVSGNSKDEVLKKADLFLLPSRYGEGLPMALLETMAEGIVPIVTDDASMKYIIQPGINGLMVNKNDPNDIVEKLYSLYLDPSNYKFMSSNAIQTIQENYNISKYILKLNEFYEKVN